MNRHEKRDSICFLTNAYPDPASPYPMYGRFIGELAEQIVRNDFRVSVVTPRIFRHSKACETRGQERIYRFWFWSDNRLLIEHRRIPAVKMVTYLLSGTLLGLRVVTKDHCGLIHAHWALPAGLIAVVVGRVLRIPVVVTVHGSDARLAFEKKGLLRMLFAWTLKRADSVTAVSRNIAEEIRALGIVEDKTIVFPMGVSDRFFRSRPAGALLPGPEGRTVIVSNRHLLPLYNVGCLIDAIPHVVHDSSDVLFLIAGDGRARPALEARVERRGLAPWVRFLGAVDHEQMPALLESSHIYVSTSPSDGTSLSLLEAMACGLFPVVTDIPANREWIEEGVNGFLVPPDDEIALAERIKQAVRDEAMRRRAGLVNMELARQKASWPEICRILMRTYRLLAAI
ncbi:MAG: glycosyltransferase [Deltaproteobacteria bacterium]|nr:glycosyltransferase [Deltaproteobacteria bacterium]